MQSNLYKSFFIFINVFHLVWFTSDLDKIWTDNKYSIFVVKVCDSLQVAFFDTIVLSLNLTCNVFFKKFEKPTIHKIHEWYFCQCTLTILKLRCRVKHFGIHARFVQYQCVLWFFYLVYRKCFFVQVWSIRFYMSVE